MDPKLQMNADETFLAHHLLSLIEQTPSNNANKRWIIGIVGIPASGKSVFTAKITKCVNRLANKDVAVHIGMDGFHYTRAHLDTMDKPEEAHRYRGAHWTFDAKGFGTLLQQIGSNVSSKIVAPTFDHSIKDPSPNGTEIMPHHKMVIVEGLYLFLNIEPWNKLVLPHFNERWFIDVDDKLAEKRIVARHVRAGIAKTEKDALFRWEDNDKPNGVFLQQKMDKAQLNVAMTSTDHGVQVSYVNWKGVPLVTQSSTRSYSPLALVFLPILVAFVYVRFR